jgi:hypothetical protein
MDESIANLIFLIIAISARINPFMFSFLLLQIIPKNENLMNIIKSLTMGVFDMLNTLFFGLIVTYIATIFSFYFFWFDYIYMNGDDSPEIEM